MTQNNSKRRSADGKRSVSAADSVRTKLAELGLIEKDVASAIEWARRPEAMRLGVAIAREKTRPGRE